MHRHSEWGQPLCVPRIGPFKHARVPLYGSAPVQDGKPHCKRLHLCKTENLTVSVCSCTRRKAWPYGYALVQDRKPCCRVCTCTRRKTSLYGYTHVQDGKPCSTSLHLYKTESLAVRVCTCTRRKTLLYESAPAQDGKPHYKRLHCTRRKASLYGYTCTRRKSLLYESAPVHDGKPTILCYKL